MYQTLHNFRLSHVISKKLLTLRFKPFRWLYSLFRKVRFTKTITRGGQKIHIPVRKGVGLMNLFSQYEPWFVEILNRQLSGDNLTVIDVGANTGQTLMKILPFYNVTGYIAVEPNPHCVNYLKDLCAINQFSAVEIVAMALSNYEGKTELLTRYDDDLLATTSSEFRKFTRYASAISIGVTTGDRLLERKRPDTIDLIKIDVEGGEVLVLEGLRGTIEHYRPVIICEILPLASKDDAVENYRKDNAGKLIDLMKSLDYSITNIVSGEVVDAIGSLSSSLQSANYILEPRERLDRNMSHHN